MKLLVLKETHPNENRVALTPELVSKYQKLGIEVFVEAKAGEKSSISDADFEKSGAKITSDIAQILPEVDAIISSLGPQNWISSFCHFLRQGCRKREARSATAGWHRLVGPI